MEWTEELRALRVELGEDEVAKRIARLQPYERYNTLVSAEANYGDEKLAFTPEQAIAFANLAKTFGKDVRVIDNKIVTEKPREEQAFTAVRREQSTREWQAKQADKS